MARDHREVVEGALRVKAMGNDLLRTIGGRAIHPINVRVGGFYKAPAKEHLDALVPALEESREFMRGAVAFLAELDFPDFEQDYEFVALRHPDALRDRGRPVGLLLRPRHRAWRVRGALLRAARPALDRAPVADVATAAPTSSGRWRATRSITTQLSDGAKEAAAERRAGRELPKPVQVDPGPLRRDPLRARGGARSDLDL